MKIVIEKSDRLIVGKVDEEIVIKLIKTTIELDDSMDFWMPVFLKLIPSNNDPKKLAYIQCAKDAFTELENILP